MIRAVIFDLDDTLYDEETYVFSGFRKVAEYLSFKYKVSFAKIYEILVNDYKKGLRRRNFNVLLEKTGIDEDVKILVTLYRTHYPKIKLYDDAKTILDYLYSNKYKLGLLTDGPPASQYNKVIALGIRQYFEVIIVTDEFGVKYRKPHPESYKLILRLLCVKPSESIFVSDNDSKDLAGAKNIGIWTVLIDRKKDMKAKYADYIINNLMELKDIIHELGERTDE